MLTRVDAYRVEDGKLILLAGDEELASFDRR